MPLPLPLSHQAHGVAFGRVVGTVAGVPSEAPLGWVAAVPNAVAGSGGVDSFLGSLLSGMSIGQPPAVASGSLAQQHVGWHAAGQPPSSLAHDPGYVAHFNSYMAVWQADVYARAALAGEQQQRQQQYTQQQLLLVQQQQLQQLYTHQQQQQQQYYEQQLLLLHQQQQAALAPAAQPQGACAAGQQGVAAEAGETTHAAGSPAQ